MKRFILILFQFVFIAIVSAQQTKVVYTCVMHPEVQMTKPGNCPKCGMTLVKKTVKITAKASSQNQTKPKVKETKATVTGEAKKEEQNKIEAHDHGKMDMNKPAGDASNIKNKNPEKDAMRMDDHSGMNMPTDNSRQDTSNMDHEQNMIMDDGMDMGNMSDPFSLHLPMERHGSGTGWLPDASPMNAHMFHSPKWMYMLHGNIFLRYTKQDITNKGSRGDEKFDAPNWIMFMGQRKVGEKGLFHFSTMLSLDPVTEGGQGYPLLFQSGEAYNGKPIVDRQHPHDLFSELSISYSHAFSKQVDAFVYLGYPGEPALGPVPFMHRPAALYNPDAPLSHHWSDATHITFGVATVGVRLGDFKLDASGFTGREPDENRYDFDKPKFDSWSGRLSYNPSGNWALQVSHGFIKSPELLHPGENINRTTASVIYSKPLQKEGWINASAVYGVNKSNGHKSENSLLLEGSWNRKRLALYSRYENVQKSVEELALDENIYGRDVVFPINAFTFGVNYDLIQLAKTRLAFGSQYTFYHADKRLNSLYGKAPMAFEVYLRIYPAVMQMHKM
jgi:hypothetical protein